MIPNEQPINERRAFDRLCGDLNSATTLVAILVQTDRKAEAEEAAEKVKTIVTDAELQEKLNSQLESALKGTVPNPWP